MRAGKRFELWAIIIICVACITGAAFGLTPEARGQRDEGERPSRAAGPGKAVFASNCARCHGVDGRGRTTLGEMVNAPDLTDGRLQDDLSNGRIRAAITRGRGQMPAFGAKLTKKEIADVAAYVREFRK